MNRGLVYSLCAMLAVAATTAQAAVNLQLNLKYTDPNNPTGGGTWQLLTKSTGGQGVVGLKAVIGGNTGVTGVDLPANQISFTGGAWSAAPEIFRYQLTSGNTEVVVGDDLVTPLTNVGTGAGASNVAADDLYTNGSAASNWNNSALLASGSWTGARPTLTLVEANVWNGTAAVLGTNGTVAVRGDSTTADTLLPGDANRDGAVDLSDFAILSGNYLKPGLSKTWDQGDFNSTATGTNEVDLSDFAILSGKYNQKAAPPSNTVVAVAAVGAVPEPASLVIASLGVLGLGLGIRRK